MFERRQILYHVHDMTTDIWRRKPTTPMEYCTESNRKECVSQRKKNGIFCHYCLPSEFVVFFLILLEIKSSKMRNVEVKHCRTNSTSKNGRRKWIKKVVHRHSLLWYKLEQAVCGKISKCFLAFLFSFFSFSRIRWRVIFVRLHSCSGVVFIACKSFWA